MQKRQLFIMLIVVSIMQFFVCNMAFAELVCPIDPPFTITSPFGYRVHPITGEEKYHSGVDIGVDSGTPIYAIADGFVEFSGTNDGYGYCIILYHEQENIMSLYAHCSALLVNYGSVKKGELIAYSGGGENDPGRGSSTGSHLHFEIIPGSNENNPPTDPGVYISEILNAEMNSDGYNPGSNNIITLEIVEDFAKVMRDLIAHTVEIATNGISLIKDMIYKLFGILLTIDLAWALITKMQDPDRGRFMVWLMEKFILYGCLVFVLTHWSDVVSGIALNSFPAIGAIEAGSNLEEAGKLLSDPTSVIQKGMNIVAQLINELLTITSISDIFAISVNAFICGLFGLVFTVIFFILGIQLAKAYLQFYFTILLSFTGFLFSGWSYTRKYGANALNGVFVASINLMFFCVFAFILTNTMQNISTAEFIAQANNPGSTVASGAIKSQEQLLSGMRRVESYGGNYHCDNGQGYYGAYQINKNYWDSWCDDYMANRGDGPILEDDTSYIRFNEYGAQDTSPEPATSWPWSPRNQDLIARFITFGYYQEYGSWEAAARAWNQGTGGMDNAAAYEYQRKVAGSVGNVMQKTTNYVILFKLLIILLVFIKMADEISGRFMKQFGTPGFKLGNEQGGTEG